MASPITKQILCAVEEEVSGKNQCREYAPRQTLLRCKYRKIDSKFHNVCGNSTGALTISRLGLPFFETAKSYAFAKVSYLSAVSA